VKIAVCIKRVPDMETRFKIAASGTAVDEAGLKYDMSDFDGYAVETALQLNEKQGPGETVVISLGPDVVQEQLRKALSMGVDRAVQLKADRVPADGLAIARALAAELKDGGYDLIFFGRQAVDSANATVGPMVAELLGLPCATAVSTLDVVSGKGSAPPRDSANANMFAITAPSLRCGVVARARPPRPALRRRCVPPRAPAAAPFSPANS
jgi:electron transfer flavoprotein beta subunit